MSFLKCPLEHSSEMLSEKHFVGVQITCASSLNGNGK